MKTIESKYGKIVLSHEVGKIDFNKSKFNYPADRNFVKFLRDEQEIKRVLNN